MNLIKLYRGNNDSVMALYENCEGYFVTETGAGWDKTQIAKREAISQAEAVAYTDDIAQHCPLCYKAVEPQALEFLEWVDEQGHTFTRPPVGDGATEYDGDDISWGWDGEDHAAIQNIPEERIWTVVDGDGDDPENPNNLYVVPGTHYVNRQFYLVLDQSIENLGQYFYW